MDGGGKKMNVWQLQKAKAHLSDVIRNALAQGSQHITLRGEPAVVVISEKEYKKLKKPKPSFIDFMRKSPLVGLNIDFNREQDLTRDVDL